MWRDHRLLPFVARFSILLAASAGDLAREAALASEPPRQSSPAQDRAQALIKREAEADGRRRVQMFERLAAMPLPQAPVNPNPDAMFLVRGVRGRVAVLDRVNRRVVQFEAEQVAGDDADDEPAEQGNIRPLRVRMRLPAHYFDELFFGGNQEAAVRARLSAMLNRRIKDIDRTFELTPAQARKLRLAGQGDVKRLLDEIQDERKRFEQIKVDEDQFRQFLREIAPLRIRIQTGLFDTGSLFEKTFRKMYDEKQLMRRSPNPRR
jgi:hypothetical protein